MRVLLINAAALHVTQKPGIPLGLLSIAKYITDAGHTVKIYDRPVEQRNTQKVLNSFNPDIVGISALTFKRFHDALAVSREVKKRNLPVVWGGQITSAVPEAILKTGAVDFVVIGEGEITFKELLGAFENNTSFDDVDGIAYLKNGEIVLTKERAFADLAELPQLDFSFVNPEKYFIKYNGCERMLHIYVSKGCPFSCNFCYNHCFHKHMRRVRPAEYFLGEIKYLIENHGLDAVVFTDDLFSTGLQYTKEICQKIQESGLKFFWSCCLKPDICTEEEIDLMYKAGCRWIFYGIDSGSPERQKIIGRNVDLQKTKQIIDYCKKIGIFVSGNFIIGFPGETEEELKETTEYIKSLDIKGQFVSYLGVLPGSILQDEMISDGYITKSDEFMQWEKMKWLDVLGANYSKVPDKELKVVWACFSWKSLFVKHFDVKRDRDRWLILDRAISTTTEYFRSGMFHGFRLLYIAVKELVQVVYYATMFPQIRKKYNLNNINK
jgi:anaerobic magnesium-protoporphyrin IX monomethyl ester cyclase